MALWGKTPSVDLTGTGTILEGEDALVGIGTEFTTELRAGAAISITAEMDDGDGGVETVRQIFRIVSIEDDENAVVAPIAEADIEDGEAILLLSPTYIPFDEIDLHLHLTTEEAQADLARDRGLKTPGWSKYTTYEDSNGVTRHKAETLVAFKS